MNTKQFIFGGIELEAIQLANEDWIFHGQIVCEECELTGTTYSRYLKDAVPKKWLTEFKIEGKVGRPALYLLEPGLYYVVSQAKTENGVKFRDWVFEEVLTAIRTDGGYISSEASKEQLTTLQDKIQAQMLAIEESYKACKDTGDERGIITLKSQLLNLTNRLDGLEEQPLEKWLSISEILQTSYTLHHKKIQNSLSTIGKLVKAEYEAETGLKVKETPKHVGTGHVSDTIKVYPEEWFERIKEIAVSYWSVVRKDRKTGEEYRLIDLFEDK